VSNYLFFEYDNITTKRNGGMDTDRNPTYGTLKIFAYQGTENYPLEGVFVEIESENLSGYTNSQGELLFTLPSLPAELSVIPEIETPFGIYEVVVSKSGYVTRRFTGEQIFENITTLRKVELYLNEGDEDREDVTNTPQTRRISPAPSPDVPRNTAVTFGQVVIPEDITVHLGSPYDNAQNVTVPYTEYLKNVIASEIYPTWPEEAIIANFYAQNSLTLNRIYTQWYKSQGYDFQITNSTAFDQAFFYDRSTFEETNAIVDRLFKNYVSRFNSVEPLFTSYCDGRQTTCEGLSQWGTVTLAREGKNYFQILTNYYGDNIEIRTAEVQEIPPDSFPGLLQVGSSGEAVRNIQSRLNRIGIDYPQLPFVLSLSSYFDIDTEIAVRAFQRIFGLPITGTVDRETWYEIQYIYTAVKQLATLGSEGERYESDNFGGIDLKQGDRGTEVLRMQWYLNRISYFLEGDLPTAAPTGIFNEATERNVREFQRYFGLTQTGIINEDTWNRIVSVYYSLLQNFPEEEEVLESYPGSPIRQGDEGENVLYIQQALNSIRNTITGINYVSEDGRFGPATATAVRQFQEFFSLTPDGIVGPETWRRIAEIYYATKNAD
jgi:peptidoglycan hydrolase-like protein with peptidoglycan-binding domain